MRKATSGAGPHAVRRDAPGPVVLRLGQGPGRKQPRLDAGHRGERPRQAARVRADPGRGRQERARVDRDFHRPKAISYQRKPPRSRRRFLQEARAGRPLREKTGRR